MEVDDSYGGPSSPGYAACNVADLVGASLKVSLEALPAVHCNTRADPGLLCTGLCCALVHLLDEGDVTRLSSDSPAHPNRHDSDLAARMSHHLTAVIML